MTEEDVAHIPDMTAPDHRNFLANFYNGSFAGSFARGADFQSNPDTGDRRTNGSFASLAGLERALEGDDPLAVDLAIERIAFGFALIASFGGIPLIYMGDELGLLNDHRYRDSPSLADDGRWMQRPVMDWALADEAATGTGPAARIYRRVQQIMRRRKACPQLASYVPTRVLEVSTPGIFAFARLGDEGTVTCPANFTPHRRDVDLNGLDLKMETPHTDLLAGADIELGHGVAALRPYQMMWICPDQAGGSNGKKT